MKRAIDLVRANPKERIPDARLRRSGIPPEQVRRWFNRHYRMTFHAFQRMYRINDAIIELSNGKNVTVAAFRLRVRVLERIRLHLQETHQPSPRRQRAERTAPDPSVHDAARSDVRVRILAGENDHIQIAAQQHAEYFSGKRTGFSVPLDTPDTDFQLRVWQALLRVPFGTTSTYQRQAASLGNRKAVRAGAQAVAPRNERSIGA